MARGALEPSAEELAGRARAGSRAAFNALVARYEKPLYHYLRVRAGSPEDAEELCQEAFLRAWQRLDAYDDRWRFSTWLFTLASRLSISALRRRRGPTLGVESLADVESGEDPLAVAGRREERDNLWRLAREVCTADQRAALWLCYVEGLPAKEIAAVIGKREATVRVILFRARGRLAGQLEAQRASAQRRAYVPHHSEPARGLARPS
jgi:RNA polymerase sigma-70 factor (ECF subfamily)